MTSTRSKSTRSEWNHGSAHARRVRGPDALEYIAVSFISLAVLTAALPFMRDHVRVTQGIEALALSQTFKTDMIVQHALYGRWPDATDPVIAAAQAQFPTRNVRSASVRPHAVVAMTLRPGPRNHTGDVLDFRLAEFGVPGAHTLMFLCGHAALPRGATMISGPDHTTLRENDLPFACRGPHP